MIQVNQCYLAIWQRNAYQAESYDQTPPPSGDPGGTWRMLFSLWTALDLFNQGSSPPDTPAVIGGRWLICMSRKDDYATTVTGGIPTYYVKLNRGDIYPSAIRTALRAGEIHNE